jgi:arylsulfatase
LPTRHGSTNILACRTRTTLARPPTDKLPRPLIGAKDNQYNPDQAQLTWYTERAEVYEKNKKAVLCLPATFDGRSVVRIRQIRGKSERGLATSRWNRLVGRTDSFDAQAIGHRQALVIFCSDNGPWLSYGEHAGSAKPLSEGKGTSFDGGHREPTVMRMPGTIPHGIVCNEQASTMDILPTIAKLTGAKLPPNRLTAKTSGR